MGAVSAGMFGSSSVAFRVCLRQCPVASTMALHLERLRKYLCLLKGKGGSPWVRTLKGWTAIN